MKIRNSITQKKSKDTVRTKPDLSSLAVGWPSSYVAREKIGEFTGGIISPKSMANIDSIGEGPKGRITCGRKVAYPVATLIAWLESRSHHAASAGVQKEIGETQSVSEELDPRPGLGNSLV